MDTPLIAVFMVTYNHENYIGQAIESVMMQKTTFPVKLFIGEDCSLDTTRDLCINYKNNYPDKIEIIFNKINIGAFQNANQIYEACINSGAKYIAALEGDDYWTDPYKLQKQVDFLEENPEYGLCYGDITIVDEDNSLLSKDPSWKALYKSGYVFKDLFIQNFIPTLTVVVRKNLIDSALQSLRSYPNLRVFDYWFWLYISMFTKFKFYGEKLAAYRDHSQGITDSKEFRRENFLQMVYHIRINIIENYCNTSDSKRIVPGIKEKLSLLKNAIKLFYNNPNSFLSTGTRLKYLFKIAIR